MNRTSEITYTFSKVQFSEPPWEIDPVATVYYMSPYTTYIPLKHRMFELNEHSIRVDLRNFFTFSRKRNALFQERTVWQESLSVSGTFMFSFYISFIVLKY